MKQVINAINTLAMKCEVNRASGLFAEDGNVSVSSKHDHPLLFGGFSKISAPGWVLRQFFCPRGLGVALSLCPGGGEFAFSKTFPWGLPGG